VGCGCVHDGTCGAEPDTYLAQAFIPDVARGTSLEISDGKTTLWNRRAPRTPVTITVFNAKLNRDHSVSASWTIKGKAVEFWLRYSTDGETWEAAVTGLTERKAEIAADFLPAGRVWLQVVAHDGFFSDQSKSVELEIPYRAPEVAVLHPREGFTYIRRETLRLWGSVTLSDGQPVESERCSWMLAQLPHCFGQLGEDRYRKSFILFKGLL
jgi:hypothetical protein